jgi:hypothetical protein
MEESAGGMSGGMGKMPDRDLCAARRRSLRRRRILQAGMVLRDQRGWGARLPGALNRVYCAFSPALRITSPHFREGDEQGFHPKAFR